jgi:hypothetical protein
MKIFGDTHALNPFEARNAGDNASRDPGVAMGNVPGVYDSYAARGMAMKMPLIVAGWGYDLFGRPVPNKGISLKKMNGHDTAFTAAKDYGFLGFENSFIDDARGSPTPFGGEAPVESFVAGALDVRYNQRHGIWDTDHYFFAEITGVIRATGTGVDTKNYVNRYLWREVDIKGPESAKDPFSRDGIQFPAKSWENGTIFPNNWALNLAELSNNSNDAVYSIAPSGSIVKIKAYLIDNNPSSRNESAHKYKPFYVFNYTSDETVFLRIDWNSSLGYPAPLAAADATWTSIGMCNRFLYRAEIQRFSSSHTEGTGSSPWGGFTPDNTLPPALRYVQAVNISEFNNPIGALGVVAPGVITVSHGPLTSSTPNLNWTGVSIPVGSRSTYPSGFSIRPIWHNTIVEGKRLKGLGNSLNTYGPVYYFSMANAHDGGCLTGVWPFKNLTAETGAGEHSSTKRTN